MTSPRHVPSWWLLSASAGAVNSTAFLASERFVSHVSGSATMVGVGGMSQLVGDAFVVLICFILGAVASVLFVEARVLRHKTPMHWASLLTVSALIAAVAFLGRAGWFGPFHDTEEVPWGLVVPLGFAMGLLNATVATATGLIVRTTHVTGPATDLGIHLGRAMFTEGDNRRRELVEVVLRGGKVIGFILGAAAVVPLTWRLGYLTLLIPAVTIAIVTARSFVPERIARQREEDDAERQKRDEAVAR